MENKNDKKTKRLALAGQLCGATLLLTLISIPLPSGYGYVNLGDAGVYLCALLLPGGLGALAAGVGAALADLILGWAMYAPVTLLVKGLTAFLAGLAFRRAIPLALLCCLLVPLGYFLYEVVLLTAPMAAVNVLPNALQAVIGAGLGTVVGKHDQRYLSKA